MLPLNVIEQLAKKLRGRESALALKSLSSLTKAAIAAHLGVGGITEEDVGAIRTNMLDKTIPLPWGSVLFAYDDSRIALDALVVSTAPVPEFARGTFIAQKQWVIVAAGEDGVDYVVAAEDAFLIPAGQLYAPLSDFHHLRDTSGVTYRNMRVTPHLAIYSLENWNDVALVLSGLFNPNANTFRTEHPPATVVDGSGSDAPADEARTTTDGFSAELVRAIFSDIGVTITLDEAAEGNVSDIVRKIKQSFIEKDKADKDAEYDIVKLEALYGKDFAAIFKGISGPVTAIKIRRAFKEHFSKKWEK